MPRVRFTVRRMMLAVAIAGVAFGVVTMKRRGDRFREEAARWAILEADVKAGADMVTEAAAIRRNREEMRARGRDRRRPPVQKLTLFGVRLLPKVWNPDEGEYEKMLEAEERRLEIEKAKRRAMAERFGRMKAKYERAARSPWLPVTPDPPEPE